MTRFRPAALALIVLAAGGTVFQVFRRPLDVHLALRRLTLGVSGVERVEAAGLAGYEKDRCAPREPCRCVALVHGLGDSSLTWDRLLRGDGAAPPPAGFRLLALDLPGTDGSPPPERDDGYSVPAQAAALRRALESRCGRWTLVGNSLGGWISLELALGWPEGIEGVVALNPGGIDDPSGTTLETARALGAPTAAGLRDFQPKAWHAPQKAPARAFEQAAELIRSRRTDKTVAAFRREHLLDQRLPSLSMPVTILWGESDRAIPVAVGRAMNRLIRGSRFELIPRCGHLPQQECPGAVASALYAP